VVNKENILSAREELEHIDRYFSKNWMDDDFPSEAIWQIIEDYEKIKDEIEKYKEKS
jgi:hypothetical protein